MKKLRSLLIISSFLVIAFIVTACTSNTANTNTNGNTAKVNTNANSNAAVTNANANTTGSVTISDFAFSPSTLTVKTGATVTWTNQDSAAHGIKSDTFNSPNFSKGGTYQFTFTTPGTYSYTCSLHPSMKGTIIVQ